MRFFFYLENMSRFMFMSKAQSILAKFECYRRGSGDCNKCRDAAKDLNLALMEILKRKDFVISEWERRFGR